MLNHERHMKIVEYVKSKRIVTNKELLEYLYISEATLRRDLTKLDMMGLLKRTHGGAQVKEAPNIEASLMIRSQTNVKEKKRIASKCLSLIKDNDSIFIDSSTSVGYVLPMLGQLNDLTIITNGITNAQILAHAQLHVALHITPGIYNYNTNSLLGIDTVNYIKNYHCNISIFSCGGLSNYGITEANHEQSTVKREMMKRSKRHILLVDHTKFDKIFMSQTCDFNDIDIIITDQKPSQEYINLFDENQCQLIIAD